MPVNPAHKGSITYQDFSKEETTFGFHVGPITALTIAAFLTQFGALVDATDDIVLGTKSETSWTGDITKFDNDPPTDPNAQRERKFAVSYQGVTSFSKYTVTIGTANLGLADLFGANIDEVDLSQTQIAAWVTAFEALCKTPEGEGTEVLAITAVGRNT